MSADVFSAAEKRDRWVVLTGLIGVSALAWLYLLYLAADMSSMHMEMDMAAMSRVQAGGVVDLFLTFVMWSVMMVAMMTPSATPMVLLFARVNRQRRASDQPIAPTGLFLLGYLSGWVGFSVLATLSQWGLRSAALLSDMLVTTSPVLGGVILLVAGLFQFTRLKDACLTHCRTPMGFILTEWREGKLGALGMGLKHGRYCLGCCWVLMALLFVAGVMNLLWVAAIATYVLAEKVAPAKWQVSRYGGLMLVAVGVWTLAAGLAAIV